MNNPVNHTDSTGHCAEPISFGICVFVGAIVVGAVTAGAYDVGYNQDIRYGSDSGKTVADIDWRQTKFYAGFGGFVGGLLGGSYGLGAAAGVGNAGLLGGSSNLVGSAISGDYENAETMGEIRARATKDVGVGAVFGTLTGKAFSAPGLQVGKVGRTPAKNGASRLTSQILGPMVARSTVVGIIGAGQGVTDRSLDAALFNGDRDAILDGTVQDFAWAAGLSFVADLAGEGLFRAFGNPKTSPDYIMTHRNFVKNQEGRQLVQSLFAFELVATIGGSNVVPALEPFESWFGED